MNDDDLITTGSVEIDLGDQGAAQPGMIDISGVSGDSLTLDPSTLTSTITLPSSSWNYNSGSMYGNYTITSPSYTTTYSTGLGIGSAANDPSVHISPEGIKMPDNTDIKIGDRSLKEFMEKMEERFAILVPDPKKLEKFEALKRAYENYKLMEKLCQSDEEEKS